MLWIYKIHRVLTADPILSAFLAGKLTALRLQALSGSPAAFGGEFVLEIFSEMSYTTWIQRLERPNVHTFIAVAYPEGTTEQEKTIDRGNIVGTAVLIGPILKSTYTMASLGEHHLSLGEDEDESKWHCTALYCSPDVRSKGVGRMLVNARIDFARSESTAGRIRIRVLVHPHNTKVIVPLQDRGFVMQGRCTPFEAISAADDAILLPPGRGAKNPELHDGPTVNVMEFNITK